jgi:WXG100 family type VII secretion target
MLTQHQISINYSNAIHQASNLRSAAERLRKTGTSLQNIETDLDSCWEGRNADTFTTKVSQAHQSLNTIVNQMNEIADAIEQTAVIYRDEQQNAYSRQQSASSSGDGGRIDSGSGGGFAGGGSGGGGGNSFGGGGRSSGNGGSSW